MCRPYRWLASNHRSTLTAINIQINLWSEYIFNSLCFSIKYVVFTKFSTNWSTDLINLYIQYRVLYLLIYNTYIQSKYYILLFLKYIIFWKRDVLMIWCLKTNWTTVHGSFVFTTCLICTYAGFGPDLCGCRGLAQGQIDTLDIQVYDVSQYIMVDSLSI